MRVISGYYKGKKLQDIQDKKIRPTTDRYKESLFNIISHSYKENLTGNILDLFCGSGALGIESLSRGCNFVVFVDNYDVALNLTKKNLISLKKHRNYEVIKGDSSTINLEKDLHHLDKNKNIKFSLVFLDPPYDTNLISESLANLFKQNILSDNCIFVCESNKDITINNLNLEYSKTISGKLLKIYSKLSI